MTSYLRSMGACGALVLGLSGAATSAEPVKPPAEATQESEPLKEVSDLAVPEPTETPEDKPAEPAQPDAPGGAETLLGGDEDPLKLLDEALAAMDEAAEELAGDTTTDKAVEHQEHAVEQLKKLLEAAQQSQSKQNQPQNSKKNSSGKGQPQDHSQGQDPQQSSSDPMGANGKRRQDDDRSGESSERVDGATQAADGTLGPGGKTNAVWGHLPPREQEALFRSLSDKFLPEYEAMIRKYYETLAEEK